MGITQHTYMNHINFKQKKREQAVLKTKVGQSWAEKYCTPT